MFHLPLLKVPMIVFSLRLFEGMNHSHMNKLQWDDTSLHQTSRWKFLLCICPFS